MALLKVKQLNIKATDKEQTLSDGRGLFFRIKPLRQDGTEGGRSFRFKYRIEGKVKWITLNATVRDGLKEARKEAQMYRDQVEKGLDPNLERELEKERERRKQIREQAQAATIITVDGLFDRWLITDLKDLKTKDEIERMMKKDVLPVIGSMAVEDVRKGHITEITDKLLQRGVNRMAKRLLSLTRQMFRFAVDRDIIEFDPTASIRKSKVGGKTVERDRVLSEDEIRELWGKAPDAGLMITTESAIWLMLSTCCRIGELSKARWEHIDFEAKTWFIPDDHSKNGKPHTVYLSDFALRYFRRLHDYRLSDVWVFPARNNHGHVCEKSMSKQVKDRQTTRELSNRSQNKDALLLSGGNWTPHDLRRTGATLMGDLGILPDVIEKCLNHIEQNKMKRVYQRQELRVEQTDAWRKLGERLELLTRKDAGNVVVFPPARV